MRKLVALVLMLGALVGGYLMGVQRATTAEGWLDVDENGVEVFLLEVDGQLYVWDVSEG